MAAIVCFFLSFPCVGGVSFAFISGDWFEKIVRVLLIVSALKVALDKLRCIQSNAQQ